ncbi:MAG: AAA family ATPase [Microthrixaceae bacterium]|nr:AAA family ATPase [Microthrixaceae bacterium]
MKADSLPGFEPDTIQWRAERMQLVNWGGFHGPTTIDFSPTSTLIAGATGSGKSTVLDAYLALMMDSSTPFNGASNDATVGRARSKEQRSLLTYLRGKLDDTTSDGEDTTRVLRGDTKATWGAISMTFIDDSGQRFSAARLFLVPRSATSDTDIVKKLCTIDGSVNLAGFADLANGQFDKRSLERHNSKLKVHPSYAQFSTTVQTRMGIGVHGDGDNAFKLLARIQAGKAVPTVDALFKTMVLDTPPTYDAADSAIGHFKDLEDSYRLMVEAEKKQKILDGITEAWETREASLATADAIAALQIERNEDSPIAHWAATTELVLLEGTAAAVSEELADARTKHGLLAAARITTKTQLSDAEKAFRDAGGATLESLGTQIERLEREFTEATKARAQFLQRTEKLAIEVDSADDLARAQATAIEFIDRGYELATKEISEKKNQVSQDDVWPNRSRRDDLEAERRSLEGRAGRVPPSWHAARVSAADALGVAPSDLPFVAELIDIAPSESEWRTAAEVMLARIAGVMLIDDRLLDRLTVAIDDLTWRTRVPYEGIEQRTDGHQERDPAMLSGKLMFKDDSPFIWWVRQRVTSHGIDALCVDRPQDLASSEQRVTRSGQTRQGRSGAHGRSNTPAVLGFDNTSRLQEIDEELALISEALTAANKALTDLDGQGVELMSLRDAHIVVRDARWDAIDAASLRARIEDLSVKREELRSNSVELADLEIRVKIATDAHETAFKAEFVAEQKITTLANRADALEARHRELRGEIAGLEERGRSHTPEQAEMLGTMVDEVADGPLDYEPTTFPTLLGKVTNVLGTRREAAAKAAEAARTQLERTFGAYKATWDDPNLGTGIDSYGDYLEIYTAITVSGLAEQREEWARRVTSWTGEDLVPLHLAFDEAIEEIRSRLAPVNTILETLPFGAHRDRLRIDLRQRSADTHARFRKQLKELSSGVIGRLEFVEVETRFQALRGFIELLRSGSGAGGHSRDYFLDVRQHIEVSAVAVTDTGAIRSKYTSLGGKSGGETQELAAFIVGAALRYQLGDETRDAPRFAPVFLDEGFVKADSEFAGRSVRAWLGLGFQLVVATALGTVNAIEPYMDQILTVTKNPTTGRARIDVNARKSA